MSRDNFERARDNKHKGDKLFEEGKLKDAISVYHISILHLRCFDSSQKSLQSQLNGTQNDGSFDEEVQVLTKQCRLNLSACFYSLAQNPSLKEEERRDYYKKCIKHCNHVLHEDKQNTKALFRKARALLFVGNVDGAIEIAKSLKEQSNSSDEIRKLIAEVAKAEKAQTEKERQTMKKMFI